MILWARSNRIALAEVQVGAVRVVMTDLTLLAGATNRKPAKSDEQLRKNLYEEYGGDVLREAVQESEGESEYDGSEEDDQE